ncbi:uncharacterized protein LOC107857617 [Capsicum annuum]|uniref:uncharacterized protein LOC107857617 n=1 Tax=Capsicum annuum TaxID=4072 RepID=UPI0007BF5D23|nr:uncharacterized protein LOC107857617 [Capsicum annuum]
MAITEKPVETPTKLVTPRDEINCSLPSLTFGNFLSLRYRSIPEEDEAPSMNSDSLTSVHLRNFGSICPNRKLQFSEHAPPAQQPVKKESSKNCKVGTVSELIRGNGNIMLMTYAQQIEEEKIKEGYRMNKWA